MTTLQRTHQSQKQYSIIVTTITVIGILLRLFHYLANRSLYTDEAYLANNLLNRNFRQLTQPLDASQHAPLFFLWVEKSALMLLGAHEYALRLFPLLCGIGALMSFYYLLKYYVAGVVGLYIGLLVFALAFPLIYYSSEIKQYSTEVLTTILAYALYQRFKDARQFRHLLLYTATGALFIWFSYPVIFVLFSIALAHLLTLSIGQQWDQVVRFVVVYGFWGISFLVNLVSVIIPNSLNDTALRDMWLTAFMPFPVHSVTDLKWFAVTFFTLFDYPLNLNWYFKGPFFTPALVFSYVGALALLLGAIRLIKTNRTAALMFVLPVLLALLASGLRKYPFTERFLLFLVPNFLLLIALGIEIMYQYTSSYSKALAMTVLLLLVAPPAVKAMHGVVHEKQFGDWKRREMKPVIAHLAQHFKPGEVIYINETSSAFTFYNQVDGHHMPNTIFRLPADISNSATAENSHQKFISSVPGNSFWVVVTGDLKEESQNKTESHRDQFLKYFDEHFTKLKDFRVKGVYTARYSVQRN